MPTYYEILGVAQNSTINEIKRAYRRLAFKWHPDKNSAPEAQAMFIQVHEAYAILSNAASRKAYDQQLDSTGQKMSDLDEKMRSYSSYAREEALKFAKYNFDDFVSSVKKSSKVAGKIIGKSVFNSIFLYIIGGVLVFLVTTIYSEINYSLNEISSEDRIEFSSEITDIIYTDIHKIKRKEKDSIISLKSSGILNVTKDSITMIFSHIEGEIPDTGDHIKAKINNVVKSTDKKNYTTYKYKTSEGEISILTDSSNEAYSARLGPYGFMIINSEIK